MSACVLTGLFAVASAAALTGEDVRQCNAMAATFEAKQAEIISLQEVQAELAAQAETLGDAWEVKEEQRLFSRAHGEAADAAKQEFEAAKLAAMRAAMDLNSKVQMFQTDAAQFNAKCASE